MLDGIAAVPASRETPRPWTLAEIAPAAGLSPAGLLKRFDSRHGVLVALSRRWIDSIPLRPVGHARPLDELRLWAQARFAPQGPHATARGLAQLVDDLVDDELRALLGIGWAREQAYLTSLLTASELPGVTDPGVAAAVLFDALNGAMPRRATSPDTDPVTRTLDTLLEMWT